MTVGGSGQRTGTHTPRKTPTTDTIGAKYSSCNERRASVEGVTVDGSGQLTAYRHTLGKILTTAPKCPSCNKRRARLEVTTLGGSGERAGTHSATHRDSDNTDNKKQHHMKKKVREHASLSHCTHPHNVN